MQAMRIHLPTSALWSALACVSAAAISGCGEHSDPVEPPPPDEITSLSATLGAEGGLIEGALGTAFEGLRVEIPAGALDQPTTITVTTTLDETPLPEGAFAVGRQYAFDPPAPLKSPALVTLPVFAEAVQGFGQDYTSVKVWLKGPQEWQLVEPSSTTAETTTIEMSTLSTTAAGVKLVELVGPGMACVDDMSCVAPDLVIEPVDEGHPPVDLARLATRSGKVFWVTQELSGTDVALTAVRLDPATGEFTESTAAHVLAGDADRDRGIGVDEAGDVWLGTRRGAAVLRFAAPSSSVAPQKPQLAGRVLQIMRGVILLSESADELGAYYYTSLDEADGAYVTALDLRSSGAPLAADAEADGTGVWVASRRWPGEVHLMGPSGDVALETLESAALPGGQVATGPMLAGSGRIVAGIGAADLELLWATGDAVMSPTPGLGRTSAIAAGSTTGDLYVGLADAPALVRVQADGAELTYCLLSDAPLDSVDARANSVRAAAVPSAGTVIVLTRDGTLLRVTGC